eukprot:scpid54811/ scgid17568/ Geranylgeranyl transferase type-1 subunit beta; Geranylgeranyl transferase type I subunit beta; Type I protein geranyl-geranyltransferase subunit beta
MADNGENGDDDLTLKKHVKFFLRTLALIPQDHEKLDSTRVTLAYFALSALDLLGNLHKAYRSDTERQQLIDWIYSYQVLPDKDEPSSNFRQCGFRGSSANGVPFNTSQADQSDGCWYDCSHIAATYASLAMLVILGDDLSRVNRQAVLAGVGAQQLKDGSFSALMVESESDLRFAYCACAICYMLNDWSTIDRAGLLDFIRRSRSYEGAFGQGPGLECHGGSTFCAIAALSLLGDLKAPPPPPSSAPSFSSSPSSPSCLSSTSPSSSPCSSPSTAPASQQTATTTTTTAATTTTPGVEGPLQTLMENTRLAEGQTADCPAPSLALPSSSLFSVQQVRQLQRWCLQRQQTGYNGRPNKATDTCYSFWLGASLKLLNSLQLTDQRCVRSFVLSTQCSFVGGFGKWPSHHPDPLHAYLGLAGLALMGEPGILPLHPALNISQRAYAHLQNLQAEWARTSS